MITVASVIVIAIILNALHLEYAYIVLLSDLKLYHVHVIRRILTHADVTMATRFPRLGIELELLSITITSNALHCVSLCIKHVIFVGVVI